MLTSHNLDPGEITACEAAGIETNCQCHIWLHIGQLLWKDALYGGKNITTTILMIIWKYTYSVPSKYWSPTFQPDLTQFRLTDNSGPDKARIDQTWCYSSYLGTTVGVRSCNDMLDTALWLGSYLNSCIIDLEEVES